MQTPGKGHDMSTNFEGLTGQQLGQAMRPITDQIGTMSALAAHVLAVDPNAATRLKPTGRLLFLAAAAHADYALRDGNGYTGSSVADLARHSRLSDSAIRSHLAPLRRIGYLNRSHMSKSLYRLPEWMLER